MGNACCHLVAGGGSGGGQPPPRSAVQIFKKEARQKRKAKLKEEMQRGYFDDFRVGRPAAMQWQPLSPTAPLAGDVFHSCSLPSCEHLQEFRDSKGKVFAAPGKLLASSHVSNCGWRTGCAAMH